MNLLVVGGNSDIGFSIAKKFYQNGYSISLTKKHDSPINKEIYNFADYEKKVKYIDFN